MIIKTLMSPQKLIGQGHPSSMAAGDVDGDGDIDVAHAFGGRSFSIYDDAGHLVFDSGNQLDEIAKAAGIYDDGRSDDKGTEPEHTVSFSMTNKKGKNYNGTIHKQKG